MADSFYGALAGATRPGGDVSGEGVDRSGIDFGALSAAQVRGRAAEARKSANWARQAIAYGLTLAGVTLAVAGVTGAGNAPVAGPTASTPPASIPPAITATPGPSGIANKPPVVGPIKANLIPTNTFYNVDASDPEGDKLTFVWTKSNPCGPFTFQDATAVWAHPHPPCPNEEFHPGTITVVVSDGKGNSVTRVYNDGSLSGVGPTPAPTPFPTTTTRPAQTVSAQPTTAQPTASPTTGGSGGPNVPLTGGGLLIGGAGVVLITQERKKKTCDREKADEERTARELRRVTDVFDDINQTRNAVNYADQHARDLDRAAAAAAKGVPTGGASGEPLHFIGKGAPAAHAAKDAAQTAHDEAGYTHRDFDAKGAQAAWQRAKDALDTATRANDAAAAALAACLEAIAPPPPPPPPLPPPVTPPPSTPLAGTPQVQATCTKGATRNEQTRTEKMELDDLSTAKVLLDTQYPGTDYLDVESFMDWAEFFKKGIFSLKNVKSFLEGPIEGTLDLVDVPDFLTYYDKMGDEILKGLRQTIRISGEKHKTGTYQLEYRRRYFTLTCRTWEECDGNDYVAKRAATVTLDNARFLKTSQLDVQVPSEVADVLSRLFRELSSHNAREEAKAKRFQEECGR